MHQRRSAPLARRARHGATESGERPFAPSSTWAPTQPRQPHPLVGAEPVHFPSDLAGSWPLCTLRQLRRAFVACLGSPRQFPPLPRQTPLTAERVGPLSGNPIAGLAIEVAFIDWLPGLRIPPWPGAPRSSTPEAGDTSAVRPVSSPTLALQTHGQRRIDSRLTLGVQIPLARRPLEVVRTSARSVRQPRLSTTLACSVCTEGQPHGGLLPVTVTLTTFSWNPGALSRTA